MLNEIVILQYLKIASLFSNSKPYLVVCTLLQYVASLSSNYSKIHQNGKGIDSIFQSTVQTISGIDFLVLKVYLTE